MHPQKRVSVFHVITRLIVGGAQENTIASTLHLTQQSDFNVKLISGPTEGPEGSLADRLENHPGVLQIVPSLVRPINPWLDCCAFMHLLRLFKREKPDIVHTHSGKAGILGRLAAAKARVPIIVHTIHGPSFGPFQGSAANTVFTAAERFGGRFTTHFIAVCDAMIEQYCSAGIAQRNQYTRIFSGFKLDPYLASNRLNSLRNKLGLTPEHVVIGKIARLFPLKGHDTLINAAPEIVSACPNARFLLVGDGILKNDLQQQIARLGLEDVFIFAGLVPPERIPEYVSAMDILVHLSRREGLARALPQAMAAGKPIVALDYDGAREVCISQSTGFLVSPSQSIVDPLTRLIRDPELRAFLGQNGQGFAMAHFSVDEMVKKIRQLYLSLLQKNA